MNPRNVYKMDEVELRAEEQLWKEKLEQLKCDLSFAKERIELVRDKLKPFSVYEKKKTKRVNNGVFEREINRKRAALERATQYADLRAEGKTWAEIGLALGVSSGRARQIAISKERLEEDVLKRS